MKTSQKDQKVLLQLKQSITDPADSFFLGLALRKELSNHRSISECLEYLNELIEKVNEKQDELQKKQDPYWKLEIYYDYLQQIDSQITCYEFLSKYIDLPKDDQDKDSNWHTEQTELNGDNNHSFQVKKHRQNTLSSSRNGLSPTFMKERRIANELVFNPEPAIQQEEVVIEPSVCSTCKNRIHSSDLLAIACEHTYHINCFQNQVAILLDQEIYPIKCLEKDCIHIPNMDQMSAFLNKKYFQIYQNCYEKYHTDQGRVTLFYYFD